MGLFGDLRKILFGTKAVANTAKEKGQEWGDDLIESGKDMFEKVKTKSDEYLNSVWDKKDQEKDLTPPPNAKNQPLEDDIETAVFSDQSSKNVTMKIEDEKNITNQEFDNTQEPNPLVEKAKAAAEQLGEKVIETTSDVWDKFKAVSENIGEKVMDKGGVVLDAFKERANEVGANLKEKAQDVWDKAQEAAAKGEEAFWEKKDLTEEAKKEVSKQDIDNIIKKTNELSEQIEQSHGNKIGYDKLNKSELEDKGDFFSRASKFADKNIDRDVETPKQENTPEPEITLELPDISSKLPKKNPDDKPTTDDNVDFNI